jgi:hypothetical protein
MIATDNLIVLLVGFSRFSGTVNVPQRAVASSGIGAGGFAHGPVANVDAGIEEVAPTAGLA